MWGQFTSPPICAYIQKIKTWKLPCAVSMNQKPNGNMDALVHSQSNKTTFTAYT